jgi:hypothetical protein
LREESGGAAVRGGGLVVDDSVPPGLDLLGGEVIDQVALLHHVLDGGRSLDRGKEDGVVDVGPLMYHHALILTAAAFVFSFVSVIVSVVPLLVCIA